MSFEHSADPEQTPETYDPSEDPNEDPAYHAARALVRALAACNPSETEPGLAYIKAALAPFTDCFWPPVSGEKR